MTMLSTSSILKLYGVPLSQPVRSVLWALLMKRTRFEFVMTVPYMDRPGMGARHDDFRNKTRARSITVPLLQDGPDVYITESAAILVYLCESRGWEADLYGKPGTLYKATIDSYLHWHHNNTRTLGRITGSYLQKHVQPLDNETEVIGKVLRRLETGWLSPSSHNNTSTHATYIAGGSGPSIADLMCYCELSQITMLGLFDKQDLQEEYPKVQSWMQRMQQLPYHDHVHAALTTLGNVKTDDLDLPLSKRLSRATKHGLKAIEDAQQDFTSKL